jgi:hypothetical protein
MPYRLTLLDYSNEKSSFDVATGPVNALTLDEVEGQAGDMKTSIDAVTLGTIQREALTAFDNLLSNTPPASKEAQREKKWLITYIDNTPFLDPPVDSINNPGYQKMFSNTVPTADLAQLNVPGSDEVNITLEPWATFVTRFQSLARSPYGGQPLVTRIMFVGRNL